MTPATGLAPTSSPTAAPSAAFVDVQVTFSGDLSSQTDSDLEAIENSTVKAVLDAASHVTSTDVVGIIRTSGSILITTRFRQQVLPFHTAVALAANITASPIVVTAPSGKVFTSVAAKAIVSLTALITPSPTPITTETPTGGQIDAGSSSMSNFASDLSAGAIFGLSVLLLGVLVIIAIAVIRCTGRKSSRDLHGSVIEIDSMHPNQPTSQSKRAAWNLERANAEKLSNIADLNIEHQLAWDDSTVSIFPAPEQSAIFRSSRVSEMSQLSFTIDDVSLGSPIGDWCSNPSSDLLEFDFEQKSIHRDSVC
jgi:hypothetical protein